MSKLKRKAGSKYVSLASERKVHSVAAEERADYKAPRLAQKNKASMQGNRAPSRFIIRHEREEDGRWLAEVRELPGVLAYGASADEAMAKAQALAPRVLAERLEHKEAKPQLISIGIAAV